MHPHNERAVSVMVDGLDEALQLPEIEEEMQKSLKVRLAIYECIADNVYVRFPKGAKRETATIMVLADGKSDTLRRRIAWYAHDALLYHASIRHVKGLVCRLAI